jgi:hypothetical protein
MGLMGSDELMMDNRILEQKVFMLNHRAMVLI